MSKLREEEKRKKKSSEAKHIIETIGKEGEKGRQSAKEFFDTQTKGEETEKSLEYELLSSNRASFTTYNSLLAKLLMKRLKYVEFPDGWGVKVAHTEDGVVMELFDPKKRMFRAGFKPVGDPFYDLNAIDTYALRAENTMDRQAGSDNSNGGIILP